MIDPTLAILLTGAVVGLCIVLYYAWNQDSLEGLLLAFFSALGLLAYLGWRPY